VIQGRRSPTRTCGAGAGTGLPPPTPAGSDAGADDLDGVQHAEAASPYGLAGRLRSRGRLGCCAGSGRTAQTTSPVNDTLKGRLDLERHGGRTPDDRAVRILQRLLALTAATWHNHHTGRPVPRSLTDYDH
jgi:hypothetical protein